MMTDPISDMLTRIRNGQAARHSEVRLPFSNLKHKLALLLARERYLKNVETKQEGGKKFLVLDLRYNADGAPAIKSVKKISTPGRRVYCKKDELPKVLSGYGLALISTPAGLMTNKEARQQGLGGEIICEVY